MGKFSTQTPTLVSTGVTSTSDRGTFSSLDSQYICKRQSCVKDTLISINFVHIDAIIELSTNLKLHFLGKRMPLI